MLYPSQTGEDLRVFPWSWPSFAIGNTFHVATAQDLHLSMYHWAGLNFIPNTYPVISRVADPVYPTKLLWDGSPVKVMHLQRILYIIQNN